MDPPHILITGGSGFLGTSIISALLNTTKYTITALDISLPPLGTQTFSSNPRVRYTRCDILDVPSISKVFAETKPTAVIHTAGIFHVGTRRYSMKDRDAVFKVNVEGTRNVLDASKEHGVKAFVYTSSITVLCDDLSRDFKNADETWPLGKTDTSYGQSKVCSISLPLVPPDFLLLLLSPPFLTNQQPNTHKSPLPPQKGPRRIPRLNLKLPLLRNHLVTFSPHFRPHRPHLHPHDTCVHQRRPNPFYPRFRDKPARLRLCRQRCARARAGGGESAVDQHYFAHGGGGSHVYFE